MGGRRYRMAALLACGLTVQACGPRELDAPTVAVESISAWSHYGGDAGGSRHVFLEQITPQNVSRLGHAWTYRHGDVSAGEGEVRSTTAFQNTPILMDGLLYICTPFNRVIALSPVTGEERWAFDPRIDLSNRYANQLVCRGVAGWKDDRFDEAQTCAHRIFTATNDARLLAIDARTGRPCADFGEAGEIDLNPAAGEQRWRGEYQVTSPPVLTRDVVVVGSAISDNARIDAPSGVIRAFDARSGELRWAWDLAPPGFDYDTGLVSEAGYALGTPNVWAPMSVDERRGLIYVPTGNAAPDYYRGERSDMNYYGSSVVALRARTGEVVWRFQTVHRDLWDFDVPSQPSLSTVNRDGEPRPALVQATKMGLLFVLDRETGEPLLPVEERPVPQDGAPGEVLSPTQPFPSIPILVRDRLTPEDAFGLTPWDRGACAEQIARYRFDGMYTPPSLQGSIMYPGNAGGSNWGGIALDPDRQVAIVRSSDLPWVVKLIPREDFEEEKASHAGHEHGPQDGTPFGMRRMMLMSPLGLPCIPPPWGTLASVDLVRGKINWQVPLGTPTDLAPIPMPLNWGVPGLGGPLVTSSGVIFIGAAMDDYLRAFDVETGEELWKGRLPAGGQATPMSYQVRFRDGSQRQYVVIAAGGHGRAGTTLGDSLVAFALDD